jgi:TRAP transporter 4TM/12TM fusion protein
MDSDVKEKALLFPRRLSEVSFGHFVALVAFAMSAYQYSVGYLGEPIAEIHRPVHLLFALLILFWSSAVSADPARGRIQFSGNLLLSFLLLLSCGYLIVNAGYIGERMVYVEPLTAVEIALGCILIVVILEAARRSVGWVLVIVGAVFIAYTLLGPYFPYPFWHRGYSIEETVEHLYLTTAGIWTTPIAVTASYIFLFVLYGSLLLSSGAGDFFTDLARALTGRSVGGPAKTAVVSSAFMGMLSGSSAANVVTTGSFTIPAMKKAGYRDHFAAGVEAVASTGGQITPPIMGSAAFIMMEFVGVDYVTVMKVSIIPALLYFISCYAMVDLEARRIGLRPILDETAPRILQVLKRHGYLLLSVVALMYYLFEGYTPGTAAFWAITYLACLVVIFDERRRRRWLLWLLPVVWLAFFLTNGRAITPAISSALLVGAAIMLVIDGRVRARFVRVVWQAMVDAPKLIAPVTVACAIGGIIVGVVILTGLGERVSTVVLWLGGGSLFLTLFITMVVAVILGMGMPTSGAYIVLATLLVPGINKMVVPYYQEIYGLSQADAISTALIATHLFIIFCASKSSITPPVAIASYAAAAVAHSDPWKTSMTAFRIGLPIFIIPYMFVYGPQLLGYLASWQIALGFVTATLGVLMLSVASIGWLLVPIGPVARGLALAGALCLMKFGWATDLIGIALFALVAIRAWMRQRRATSPGVRALR